MSHGRTARKRCLLGCGPCLFSRSSGGGGEMLNFRAITGGYWKPSCAFLFFMSENSADKSLSTSQLDLEMGHLRRFYCRVQLPRGIHLTYKFQSLVAWKSGEICIAGAAFTTRCGISLGLCDAHFCDSENCSNAGISWGSVMGICHQVRVTSGFIPKKWWIPWDSPMKLAIFIWKKFRF